MGRSKRIRSDMKQGNDLHFVVLAYVLSLFLLIYAVQDRDDEFVSVDLPELTFSSLEEHEIFPIDLYVMAKCPYGVVAENEFLPVLEEFRDVVDFDLNFIAGVNPDGSVRSLHGESEIVASVLQLCAKENYPLLYMDFIVCMNEDSSSIPSNWESCASSLGLNTSVVRSCFDGEQGRILLSRSIGKSMSAGVSSSPTMYVDGEMYLGRRDSLSFRRALCERLSYEHPACVDVVACINDLDCTRSGKIGICRNSGSLDSYCEYIDPVPVKMWLVNDPSCVGCDPSVVVANLRSLFPGIEIITVDSSSDLGKDMISRYVLEFAPAYLFDADVVKTYRYITDDNLKTAFIERSDRYLLHPKSTGSVEKFEK